MKKRSFILASTLLLFSLSFSCTREIAEDTQLDALKAQQFTSGQITGGKTYFVKNAAGLTQFPFHEIGSAFRNIREANPGPAEWKTVDEQQRKLIAAWTSNEPNALPRALMAELELNTYLFLDNYLLKGDLSKEKKEPAAFYLRLLIDQIKVPSQWDLLARTFVLGETHLEKEEAKQIRTYILNNAHQVLSGNMGPTNLKGIENQQKAATLAVALISEK